MDTIRFILSCLSYFGGLLFLVLFTCFTAQECMRHFRRWRSSRARGFISCTEMRAGDWSRR